jgi:tetratricopeptide (TPR) repeat protein
MNKLISLSVALSLAISGVLYTEVAQAKVPADKLEEVKKRTKARGGKAPGPRVGKKVVKAFDLYSEDLVNEAIEVLLEVNSSHTFDRAYVDRFIGNMYAGIEGKSKEAFKYLERAYKADILSFGDHGGTIKLLADLSLQEKRYKDAIKYYKEYLEFSLDQDDQVYLRIANAHYELKEYSKVKEPAEKAIKFASKPNQNPYIMVMASYYERKMYKDATKWVEILVKNFPEEKKWWPQLGMFYMLTEQYEKGLSAMELAYKQGYLDKESQIKQLAQLYSTNGVPYKAAVTLEKHMKEGLVKKTKDSVSIMANVFHSAKELNKASKYYGEAAQLGADADLYRRQGNLFMAQEKFNEAIKSFEKSIDLKVKRKGVVYMGIAEANFYLQNWKEAYTAIKLAEKDKSTAKSARSWKAYIKDTARRKGTVL